MVETKNNTNAQRLYESTLFSKTVCRFESAFHKALLKNLDSMGYTLNGKDEHVERIVASFFIAVATFLSQNKTAKTDEATAFIVDDKGTFGFAAFVEYNANEADPNPDELEWVYSATLCENDLEYLEKRKTVKKFFMTDSAFQKIFKQVGYDIGGFVFLKTEYLTDVCNLIINSINQVLDNEIENVIRE